MRIGIADWDCGLRFYIFESVFVITTKMPATSSTGNLMVPGDKQYYNRQRKSEMDERISRFSGLCVCGIEKWGVDFKHGEAHGGLLETSWV